MSVCVAPSDHEPTAVFNADWTSFTLNYEYAAYHAGYTSDFLADPSNPGPIVTCRDQLLDEDWSLVAFATHAQAIEDVVYQIDGLTDTDRAYLDTLKAGGANEVTLADPTLYKHLDAEPQNFAKWIYVVSDSLFGRDIDLQYSREMHPDALINTLPNGIADFCDLIFSDSDIGDKLGTSRQC